MSNHRIAVFGSGMSGLLAQQLDSVKATRELGFEQGVKAERERLVDLIEAAKSVRDSLQEYDQDKHASGEVFYCEMMSESVDLLAEAINNYEATINDK